MTKVFISYSRKDKLFAEKLDTALKEIGLDSWIDWIDIPPTADWWDQIEKGIESADAFLVLLSPDSTSSKICRQEIDHAIKNGKRLIPLVVRDVKPDEVHESLQKLNWIFFRENDEFSTSLKKLEAGIKTDLAWVESHRRLQIRALEWEERRDRSLLLRGKDLGAAEIQLASSGQKDPQPTDLQRQYILESRRRESQTRNTLLSVGGVVLVMLALLSVFAFNQRNLANDNAMTAVANQNIAIANEQEADRQSNIALARQLAAQAQFIAATDPLAQELAVLLATRSMQLFPTGDAANVLQNTTLASSIAHMQQNEPVTHVAFSPAGTHVLSDSTDGSAYIWEITTGNQVGKLPHEAGADPPSFSPDGKYLVSGSTDGTIRVWEVSTGSEVAHMNHDDSVTALVFGWDSKYVVSGSRDGTARVWETATGKEVARMIHDGAVTSVAFSMGGDYVVSGSEDNTARVWEAATGAEIARMSHDTAVLSLDLSMDGQLVASGDAGGGIRVWEFATGNEVARVDQSGWAVSFALSPSADYLLTVGVSSATVWETNTGNQIANADFGDYAVEYSVFSPDGRYIVSRGSDGTARIWQTDTGDAITYLGADISVNSIHFNTTGQYVAAGGCKEYILATCHGGFVRILETATGQEIAYMPQEAEVRSVAFSADAKYVLAGSEDGSVHIWNSNSNKEIISIPDKPYISFVAFSADNDHVISDGSEGLVGIWEITSGNQVSVIPTSFVSRTILSIDGQYESLGVVDDAANILRVWDPTTGTEISRMNHDMDVSSFALSEDGKYVVSASQDKAVRVWDAATGNELAQIRTESEIWSVSFSPTAKYVVSTGDDGIARVWDVSTAKEIARMVHDGRLNAVAFSPDERFMASAFCDQLDAQSQFFCQSSTILVWDVATIAVIARMNYDSEIWDMTFSPDGKYIAAGGGASINLSGQPGALLIWEASTGVEVIRIPHDLLVTSVVFSPDGRYVASAGGEGIIRVWTWQPEDRIEDACSRVTRNLSREEWAQYLLNQPFPMKQEESICSKRPIETAITITPSVTP